MYSTSHQPISVADFGWMLNYVKHLIWLISNFPGTYLPMKMEQTECSETSAYKIQAPGTRPKESIHNIWYDFVYKICVFLLISIFFFGRGEGWLQGDSLPSKGAPTRCPENSVPLLQNPEISYVYNSWGAIRRDILHKTNRIFAYNTSQQDFGTRKVYCVSNVTSHAESKYAIKMFPSSTVFVQWPFKLLIFRNFWYFHQWFFYTRTNILNGFEPRVVTYNLPLSYL